MAKQIAITITSAVGNGGVHYAPKKGEPGKDLLHGETHTVDEHFAKVLIRQKRAVLADPNATLSDGPLTTDLLNADPTPETPGEPARRRR